VRRNWIRKTPDSNVLGITLSEKAMRVATDTAPAQSHPDSSPELRRDAQTIWQLFIVAQNPSRWNLARWHYHKALAVDTPPNFVSGKAAGGPKAATTTQ